MDGGYSSFPANYVTLKDLKERWIKRKQEEEEKKLLELRQEEDEKLRKLRQDEENKLPKLRREAENRRRKEKEEANPTPKSKLQNLSSHKSPHSTPSSASLRQTRAKPASGINVKGSAGTIGARSEESPAISGRRRKKTRKPASHPIPAKDPQTAVEIADKKAEKLEKGLEIARTDPTAEMIKRVANIRVAGADKKAEKLEKGLEIARKDPTAEMIKREIRVAGADKGRREILSSGRGRRGRIPFPATGSGMVWVRKTTEA